MSSSVPSNCMKTNERPASASSPTKSLSSASLMPLLFNWTYLQPKRFASLIISLPVIFYHLWSFLAPGLYENEKKYIMPFVAGATGMFIAGALFAYYFVFPVGFAFLVNFGGEQTTAMISIAEYLGFFLKLMFGFGLSFELPVVAALLAFFGLVDDKQMKASFRYAIVIIFIVAAVLTPPDVMSQLMMAIPMILLYGAAIVIVKMINPAPKEEGTEAA